MYSFECLLYGKDRPLSISFFSKVYVFYILRGTNGVCISASLHISIQNRETTDVFSCNFNVLLYIWIGHVYCNILRHLLALAMQSLWCHLMCYTSSLSKCTRRVSPMAYNGHKFVLVLLSLCLMANNSSQL
jgi:hypothetical protein